MLDNSNLNAEETVDAVIKIVNNVKKKQKNFYMKAHKCLAPLIRLFSGIKTHGKENIPREGGYMLCANHIAVRDVLLMGATCPRQIKFVAKKELFSIPILGKLITVLGAIKIDRGGNDVGAIKASISAAENGGAVAIFPQGHRYPAVDPSKTPIKNGAGMVAYRSGCDVIPVFIKTKGNKYGIFKRVDIF
jgi:1-acyl-sn-glycerol-3-phosphate acyltransferase